MPHTCGLCLLLQQLSLLLSASLGLQRTAQALQPQQQQQQQGQTALRTWRRLVMALAAPTAITAACSQQPLLATAAAAATVGEGAASAWTVLHGLN